MKTTTILGQTYRGRPGMGSVACQIMLTEQLRGHDAAERLLKAKNSMRKVWGLLPHNLQDDMTDIPMEGVQIFGRKQS